MFIIIGLLIDDFQCDTYSMQHEQYRTSPKDEFGIFMASAEYFRPCITRKKSNIIINI